MANLPVAKTSFVCRGIVATNEVRQAVMRLAEMYSSTHSYYEESRLDGPRKYRLGLRDLPMNNGYNDILITPFNGKTDEWFVEKDGTTYWAVEVRSRRTVQDMDLSLPDVDNDPLIDLVMEVKERLNEILERLSET